MESNDIPFKTHLNSRYHILTVPHNIEYHLPSTTKKMSQEAYQAERDLNTYQAKTGRAKEGVSDTKSGVDASVEYKFPGSQVKYGPGSTASGSDHRIIPPEEGGRYDDRGHLTKGEDFLGQGGSEDTLRMETESRSGDQDTATGRMPLKHSQE
ncbi:hypothetical protein, variant [Blastomyces dermatitidis ER-3]|uniref:Uncharacterized protein n=2 Tax=Blastomyces TaxID=229219 RepID=A0A179ULR7_BLAGS|nr:hypothetical protein, variant [Blastomyces gilchristii SLH14081]XP_045282359.1 hypothetical protein, variant [Blastomyces dermatitidis ER-3]OAT02632.1 hypothetical protein, variant [Blastomyces dermatitidis ER-3]OAT08169.1 hypothetical protein, variant [Blastomyces gilchristii SLH14081]